MFRSGAGARPTRARLHRHRALAGVAATLWLLGFELVPGLHIALHDRLGDHQHADARAGSQGPFRGQIETGPGSRADRVEDLADDHRGHGHRGHGRDHTHPSLAAHADETDASHPVRDGLDRPRPAGRDAGHGAGSLAHRGLAAVDPPPPARLPDLFPADASPRPLEPTAIPRFAGPLTARGRGPPSASA